MQHCTAKKKEEKKVKCACPREQRENASVCKRYVCTLYSYSYSYTVHLIHLADMSLLYISSDARTNGIGMLFLEEDESWGLELSDVIVKMRCRKKTKKKREESE